MTCCHCQRPTPITVVRVVVLPGSRRIVEHWCIRCHLRECTGGAK